ncbi:MAG: response regulator [Alphaproteobacteria bacterium]|nr:response regulator [Alphaproteobacteria bacterium]
MPRLDPLTLLLTASMVSVVTIPPILLLRMIAPADHTVRRWLWASVVLALSALLFAMRSVLPEFVTIVLANVAYVGGVAAVMEGVLDHAGSPWRRRLAWPAMLATAAVMVPFTYIWPDLGARIVGVSLVMSVMAAITCGALLRLPDRTLPLTYMLVVFGVGGLTSFARMLGTPFAELHPDFLANTGWFQAGLLWVHQGTYVAVVGGMGLLVVERLVDQVRAERKAHDAQLERLRDVVDSTPGVVWECYADTFVITYISPQVEALTGYTVEQWKAPGAWGAYLHPDDLESTLAYTREKVATGREYEIEYRLIAKDGRVIWIFGGVTPVAQVPGERAMLRGVVMDNTERKLLEQELVKAKEGAERADRAKSSFLAQMSHELRTPMNGVVALLDVALSGELSADQRQNLTVASQSAARLMEILDDILDHSRIEAGRVEIQPTAFAPVELLESLIALFQAQAQAKGLSLQLSAKLPGRVRLDGRYVGQIVTNLISNAVKYTELGGVSVRAFMDGGSPRAAQLVVEVEDTGPGVPEVQRDEVFVAFERGEDGVRSQKKGVGLGLAISRQLAEIMGGTLSLHAGGQGGALFRLQVPVEVLTDPAEPVEVLPLLSESGFTVLVVEDDNINRFVFSRMFATLGLDIRTADSGERALELLEEGMRPDAMFIDIRLPGIDGHETARRVRAKLGEGCPTLIALTANAYPEDRDAAKAAGMDAFLEKPLRLDALRATLVTLERGYSEAQRV